MRALLSTALLASTLVAAFPACAGPAENKALVAGFIRDVFVARNAKAAERYLAKDYIQHNPHVAPGRDGFIATMTDWMAHMPADLHEETSHMVAEGDLVAEHNVLTWTGKDGQRKTVSGFDLYRVDGDRIVEHWDADQ